jgi:hypothetical protein
LMMTLMSALSLPCSSMSDTTLFMPRVAMAAGGPRGWWAEEAGAASSVVRRDRGPSQLSLADDVRDTRGGGRWRSEWDFDR